MQTANNAAIYALVADYDVEEKQFGKTRTGYLQRMRHRNTGEMALAKVGITRVDSEDPLREIDIMATLSQTLTQRMPGLLLPIRGSALNRPRDTCVLLMDYADQGELFRFIKPRNDQPAQPVALPTAKRWFAELAAGVAFLHAGENEGKSKSKSSGRPPIAHLDIACENILLQTVALPGNQTRVEARLADFGFSTSVGFFPACDDETRHDCSVCSASPRPPTCRAKHILMPKGIGRPPYLPPEQHTGRGSDPRSYDMFALGVVLFHMLTALTPFEYAVYIDIRYRALSESSDTARELLKSWQVSDLVPDDALDLLVKLFGPDDTHAPRPTAVQVLAHPFLADQVEALRGRVDAACPGLSLLPAAPASAPTKGPAPDSVMAPFAASVPAASSSGPIADAPAAADHQPESQASGDASMKPESISIAPEHKSDTTSAPTAHNKSVKRKLDQCYSASSAPSPSPSAAIVIKPAKQKQAKRARRTRVARV